MQSSDDLKTKVLAIYENNPFMHLCGIEIAALDFGKAVVSLQCDSAKHGNTRGYVHGGLYMTLMDNATGLACAMAGKRVVTVSTTVDFIKAAKADAMLQATCNITKHEGNKYYLQMKVENAATHDLLTLANSVMLAVEDIQ